MISWGFDIHKAKLEVRDFIQGGSESVGTATMILRESTRSPRARKLVFGPSWGRSAIHVRVVLD
jgi:hypothetical protein